MHRLALYLLNPVVTFFVLSGLIFISFLLKIQPLTSLFENLIDFKAIISAYVLSLIFSSVIPFYISKRYKVSKFYLFASILFSGFVSGTALIVSGFFGFILAFRAMGGWVINF